MLLLPLAPQQRSLFVSHSFSSLVCYHWTPLSHCLSLSVCTEFIANNVSVRRRSPALFPFLLPRLDREGSEGTNRRSPCLALHQKKERVGHAASPAQEHALEYTCNSITRRGLPGHLPFSFNFASCRPLASLSRSRLRPVVVVVVRSGHSTGHRRRPDLTGYYSFSALFDSR